MHNFREVVYIVQVPFGVGFFIWERDGATGSEKSLTVHRKNYVYPKKVTCSQLA